MFLGELIKIPDFVIILTVYAILNMIAFMLYLQDKNAARKNSSRIPENLLLVYALIGPFGAFAAMQIFRHKTLKLKFFLVPGFMVLHGFILIQVLIFMA